MLPTDEELRLRAKEPSQNIVVQVDEGPMLEMAAPPSHPRPPALTILRSGDVFRRERTPSGNVLLHTKVSPSEVDAVVRRVIDLGFERLRTQECACPIDSSNKPICTANNVFTTLRALDSSGELGNVVVYAGHWNEPETAERILAYLDAYRPAGLAPYVPQKASAFFISHPTPVRRPCTVIDADVMRAFHRPSSETFIWTAVLEGPDLVALLGKLPTNSGSAILCTKTEILTVGVSPWLPGADGTAYAERWSRRYRGFLSP